MKKNTAAKGKFKSKGASILKPKKPGPESIKEFLWDSTTKTTTEQKGARPNAQNHKSENIQIHTSAKIKSHKIPTIIKTESFESNCPTSEKIERLHVHIRKDLADALLEMVFRRKCDRKMKKKQATQRVIIEEALEEYFSNENN
jgi:hypothetical protein